ncbi:MAG: hypothetical protein IJ511_06950 [Bacteroides sp.]|nr:hypothetical protein [Bacteroides sp.]
MNKQFWNVLLCGAALVLSTGTFTACGDDTDELESRVAVLEGAYADLKDQLGKALTTGSSVVSAENKDGVWTLKLSDGTTIVIDTNVKASTGGSTAGGSAVTVEQGEGSFTITVDGTSYTIPTGATVNSLVYVPEYADGKVIVGNEGATVKFLARPAISDLSKASFSIVDVVELKTRSVGSNNEFVIAGDVTESEGYLSVPLKGIKAVAGASYAVALQVNCSGTVITSNYFTVEVAEDFYFESEKIGDYAIKAEYQPTEVDANGFCSMTIDGLKLLSPMNFKDLFDQFPENAQFQVAPHAEQPGGKAQEKWELLDKSLAADGSWDFYANPGTSFNDNAEQPGFLVYVVADNVTKAKIYVKISDALADVDFTMFTGGSECEWGGREKYLQMGAQTIDIQAAFQNFTTEFPIIHNNQDKFFDVWASASVSNGDDLLIFNNDGRLELTDEGKKYVGKGRGIFWFYRGFAIYVPETVATDGKYIDENGKEYSAGEGYGYDFWMGQPNDYVNDPVGFYSNVASWNVTIDEKTGVISLPDTYTGYGLRMAIVAAFEYAYGVKTLVSGDDKFVLAFFNRRLAPAEAKMPAPKKD